MIKKEDVEKTARLARVQLNSQEVEQYQGQLKNALNHFQAISEVDTINVEPMYTPIESALSLRDDVSEEFPGVDQALENAPDLQGRLYRVPPVV